MQHDNLTPLLYQGRPIEEARIIYERECGLCRQEYGSDTCLGHFVLLNDPDEVIFDSVGAYLPEHPLAGEAPDIRPPDTERTQEQDETGRVRPARPDDPPLTV